MENDFILEIIELVQLIISKIIELIKLIPKQESLILKREALGNILAFDIAIFAFLFPLSVSAVAKISEIYNSELLSKHFLSRKRLKYLYFFLILHIFLIVFINFSLDKDHLWVVGFWHIITWIIFGLFFIVLVMIIFFTHILIKYLTDINYVLTKIFNKPKKIIDGFSKQSKIRLRCKKIIPKRYREVPFKFKQKKKLIENIEIFGDIILLLTERRNRNNYVTEKLRDFLKLFETIFDLQSNNEDNFKKLIFSEQLFKDMKENKENANFRLALFPEIYTETYNLLLSTFSRIHESTLKNSNTEISVHISDLFSDILNIITKKQDNDIFLRGYFNELNTIRKNAKKLNDPSFYRASTSWYFDYMFPITKKNFHLCYLNDIKEYFFNILKSIIHTNDLPAFEIFIDSAYHKYIYPDWEIDKIWDYAYLMFDDMPKYKEFDYNKRVLDLRESLKSVSNKEQFDLWQEKFNELMNLQHKFLPKKSLSKAKTLENEILEFALETCKFNSFLWLVFEIGAFCLYKKRYDFISELWNYKQPKDADSHWVGHVIVPNDFRTIFNQYFKRERIDNLIVFWDGAHGSSTYIEKYFLLLLYRIIDKTNSKDPKQFFSGEIKSLITEKIPSDRLSTIQQHIQKLLSRLKEIKDDEQLFIELDFPTEKKDDNLEILKYILEEIKETSSQRIKEKIINDDISQKKVSEIKQNILSTYKKYSFLYNLSKKYDFYEDKTEHKTTIYPKEYFFDNRSLLNMEDNIAQAFIRDENNCLIGKLCEKCKKTEYTLDEILEEFPDIKKCIIILKNIHALEFFSGKNFVSKKDSMLQFEGFYLYKNVHIPVVCVRLKPVDVRQFSVLNIKALGKFIHSSPLEKEDNPDNQKEMFWIDIQQFYSLKAGLNETLVSSVLKNPCEEIKKLTTKEEKIKYLKEKAVLSIKMKFDLVFDDNFKGYAVDLK